MLEIHRRGGPVFGGPGFGSRPQASPGIRYIYHAIGIWDWYLHFPPYFSYDIVVFSGLKFRWRSITDIETSRLSAATRIGCESLVYFLPPVIFLISLLCLQDNALIWCIGWQRNQGQGITILGG